MCTRAHTEVRTPSLKPLLTLTPQLYPPLATHLLSFIPITGLTVRTEDIDLPGGSEEAMADEHPPGSWAPLGTILWSDAAPSLLHRSPSEGDQTNQF